MLFLRGDLAPKPAAARYLALDPGLITKSGLLEQLINLVVYKLDYCSLAIEVL